MANHVHNFVQLQEANEAASEYFKQFASYFEYDKTFADTCEAIRMIYPEHKELTEEEMNSREFYVNTVGAKWLTPDGCEDDSFTCTTAWSSADSLFERLAEKLKELDPNVKLYMTYEDEMPNFVGVATYNGTNDDLDFETIDSENFGEIIGVEFLDIDTLVEEGMDESEAWDKVYEVEAEFWEAWYQKREDWIAEAWETWEE